jgi:hypothetical protein
MSSDIPTIDDINEVIAGFEGYQFLEGDPTHKCPYCIGGDEPCSPAINRFVKNSRIVFHYELKYHSSWDALIPVCKKIKSTKITGMPALMAHMDATKEMNNGLVSLDIEKTHKGVYNFIVWLNNQNKNQ